VIRVRSLAFEDFADRFFCFPPFEVAECSSIPAPPKQDIKAGAFRKLHTSAAADSGVSRLTCAPQFEQKVVPMRAKQQPQ